MALVTDLLLRSDPVVRGTGCAHTAGCCDTKRLRRQGEIAKAPSAAAAIAAARVPVSEEEAEMYREMELDRQLSGTTRRCSVMCIATCQGMKQLVVVFGGKSDHWSGSDRRNTP